jgi:hypothetical protein
MCIVCNVLKISDLQMNFFLNNIPIEYHYYDKYYYLLNSALKRKLI